MSRVYVVSNVAVNPVTHRLIRAHTNAGARNFAARDQFEVDVAGQDTIIDLISSGVKVEDATAEPQS